MFTDTFRRLKDDEGFTLIELLITVVILAVVMGIAIPVYVNNKNAADSAIAKTEVVVVGQALADGLSTGSVSGYSGAAGYLTGDSPLTGFLTTQTGLKILISPVTVYYDSTANPPTWCVSEDRNGTIWMKTNDFLDPEISTVGCTSSTSVPVP